ncbi:hypothetical protein, partial [Flavobacterium psychrophilum]|uniref:hypothetical protein n=1 Tax=Flavobacterium psychrophilum TaxID=96345 RepID=UPI001ABC38D5
FNKSHKNVLFLKREGFFMSETLSYALKLYQLIFKNTGIFIEDVVIPRNEESHNLNNLMRFLVPRNDKLYVFLSQ